MSVNWTTTVYGRTLSAIRLAASNEAEAFGIKGRLDFDIRPHTVSRAVDGVHEIIDYEAVVTCTEQPQ